MDLRYMFDKYCKTLHSNEIMDIYYSQTQLNYEKYCLLVYNKSSKCII